MSSARTPPPLHLSLPATSANLGPGFDAVGLALSLRLDIQAAPAAAFAISAEGRDADGIRQTDRNLILDTYTAILREQGRPVLPLRLQLQNDIPLGMGCGSSAAALCAGVFLADHFGDLEWSIDQILDEAARREGHPDNVAACIHGGFTVSRSDSNHGTTTATFGTDLPWRLLLALPQAALSTHVARALLPDTYSRADAVQNIQATALLVSAFALNRPELLRVATQDRLHQPYRREACALFASLEPLTADPHVHSVTLSGAGPSTLFIVNEAFQKEQIAALAGPLLRLLVPLSIGQGARKQTLAEMFR